MRDVLRAAAAALSLYLVAAPAPAQTPVVVELYTSQGCSSCPPADALLGHLAARDDVIALALHVDYWDYLGWKDVFAQRRFTERQKAYARHAGVQMIYTPQMIVAGVGRVAGLRGDDLGALIRERAGLPATVRLALTRDGETLRIAAKAERPFARPVEVHLVRYTPNETVRIERGENAGRVSTHHNVVTVWEALALWPGDAPLEVEADVPGADPVVVIVQEPGPGAIIAAARLR